MGERHISRRQFLKYAALLSASSAFVASCAPAAPPASTPEVKVVEKEVTRVVAGTPEVVTVQETVIVEKEKVVEVVASPAAPEVVTIRYEARAGAAEEVLYAQRIGEFNAQNPNFKAVLELIPGGNVEYDPKILSLYAAGSLGDALWTAIGTGVHYFLASKGITEPLDDLVASGSVDLNQWYKSSVESTKLNGKMYGLPLKAHAGGAFIYYNKTMFDKEGVPEPKKGWKLDELLTDAKALTKRDGDKTTQFGVQMYVSAGRLMDAIARTYGGDIIDSTGKKAMLSDPKSIDAWKWLCELYATHKVSPSPQVMTQTGTDEFQMMVSGQLGMFQAGPWGGPVVNGLTRKGGATGAPFEWGAVPLAMGPANVVGSHAEVDCVCVASTSKHKDGAFKLIQAFSDKEAGVQLCLGDSVCGARTDLYDDPRVNGQTHTKDDKAYFAMLREVTENAMPFYYPANFRLQEMDQYITQSMAPLFLLKEEPSQQFFDRVNKGLQDILDKPPA